MIYKTTATNKETGEKKIFEMEYNTKRDFIKDIRANGYKVNDKRVKTKEEWDRIINETNCEEWEW